MISGMSISAMGIAPTRRASRYLQQLCQHMSQSCAVDFHLTAGRIALPLGEVELNAGDMALLVTCTPHRAADMGPMQRVVGDHLSRFALDDGVLALHWGRC
jgi:hypothetical protein